ncbi:MAG: GntR family transcriptional regulator [Anaerolineae bacterium]|jgi:DNA-binding GntR family transcriptional regulator|nr:GntR family transcriptional regulator [Anaerolineae bacterium]
MTQSPALQLHHIENKPLRERVLDILRDAIVSGDMRPGQPLVEMELAQQMGISRAPLREALQILSQEGLVETIPYKGTQVRSMNRMDIEELYSLRSVLETFAVQRIIARRSADDTARLRAIFEAMLAAAQQGDLSQVNEIDRQFHDGLIELSQHHLLLTTWRSVSLRIRQVMALTNRRNRDLTVIAYNHLPMVEAIAAHDEAEATRLLREHVESAAGLIVEGWTQPGESDPK